MDKHDRMSGMIEPDEALKLWAWQYNKAAETGKSLDDIRVMAAMERTIVDPYALQYHRQVCGSWVK